MKRRHVLLRSLILAIFIGTGELFNTGKAGNGKELSEAMSENGNIQLSSQNDYISPSPMLAGKSFPIADCCIPLCQRLR